MSRVILAAAVFSLAIALGFIVWRSNSVSSVAAQSPSAVPYQNYVLPNGSASAPSRAVITAGVPTYALVPVGVPVTALNTTLVNSAATSRQQQLQKATVTREVIYRRVHNRVHLIRPFVDTVKFVLGLPGRFYGP